MTSEQAKQLRALADQVEAATGPDRELDAEIITAVFGGEIVWKTQNYTMEQYPVRKFASRTHISGFGYDPIESPTASTDAALTLVPEGHGFTVGQNVHHGHWVASVNYLNREGAPDSRGCSNACRGPAQALTAAALRAHASLIDADAGEGRS